MLSLGRDCKQPLRSLTRICENGKWKMENCGACGAIFILGNDFVTRAIRPLLP